MLLAYYFRFVSELKSVAANEENLKNVENFTTNNQYAKWKNDMLSPSPEDTRTICQGLLLRENIWFRKTNDTEKVVEARVLDWQRVRYGPGALDLATILAQCKTGDWNNLIESYAKTVQRNVPAVSVEDIRKEIASPGFFYALLILSADDHQLLQFLNKLSSFLTDLCQII